ncbi:MAG: hypothetical protein H6541_13610 [Lentimicrobiaceae bacterium]|nr:hypothetical protein [Lentimicrobiaceae bacterium]HPG32423.1 hypothetical protein [Lentimicrobium sp.]
MKNLFRLMLLAAIFITQVVKAQTNDFYDDAPQFDLKMQELFVAGEVANPGKVDFSKLSLRQMVVKETALEGENGRFEGAYQYEGYSLYDILDNIVLKKNNESEFPPIIDLYVEVENAAGEKVVLSWGEIYYPIHRHEIMIASKVRRIVPSKTKDLWPLPADSKLVVASDLYTERNISAPVRITVKSSTLKYTIDRNIPDMYAGELKFTDGDKLLKTLTDGALTGDIISYGSVFYGRGMGIHGTTPFNGVMLKNFTGEWYKMDQQKLRTGLFVASAPDGYRAVFTFSEIFNRNDQAEVLIVPMRGVKSQGAYLLYPAADFFSDRSIRCWNRLTFMQSADM